MRVVPGLMPRPKSRQNVVAGFSRRKRIGGRRTTFHGAINPRLVIGKFGMFGNTYGTSAVSNPNHVAIVPAYCSTEVVGIQRPRALPVSASSGPSFTSVGNGVPFEVLMP